SRPPIPSGELPIKNLVPLHTYVERFPAPQWIFQPKVWDSVVEKVHQIPLHSQIATKTRQALGFEPWVRLGDGHRWCARCRNLTVKLCDQLVDAGQRLA